MEVKAAQENFQFRPADLTYGSTVKLLWGRVMVDQVPVSQQVTPPPGDHDYPAAASDSAGNVWVACVKFSPNPKFLGIRTQTPAPITDFDELAEPPGVTKFFLVRYSAEVEFSWRDETAVVDNTSYYYVRGEQEGGELVWASPLWITYRGQ